MCGPVEVVLTDRADVRIPPINLEFQDERVHPLPRWVLRLLVDVPSLREVPDVPVTTRLSHREVPPNAVWIYQRDAIVNEPAGTPAFVKSDAPSDPASVV